MKRSEFNRTGPIVWLCCREGEHLPLDICITLPKRSIYTSSGMSGVGIEFGRERGVFWSVRGKSVCPSSCCLPSSAQRWTKAHGNNTKWSYKSPQPSQLQCVCLLESLKQTFWPNTSSSTHRTLRKQVFEVSWVFFHKLECEIPWTGLLEADWPWWSKLGFKFAQLLTHMAIGSLEEKPKTKDTAAAKRAVAQPGLQQELVSTVKASRSQIQKADPQR